MVIAGYVISLVTGVAVGFVFAIVILFCDKFDRFSQKKNRE
jgi:energy-converting hydrogenase Eha subunit A